MKSLNLILLLLTVVLTCHAQDIPERPNPPRLVNDFAELLSKDEQDALEHKLLAYNDSTSSQVAIVTIHDLGDYDAADYAQRLAEKWGIGQKGKNNGVLIFVSTQPHRIQIETGYGMEGVIPDALAKRIVETEIKPAFKEKNFYKGFDDATTVIFKLASGEYKADDVKQDGNNSLIFIIIICVIAYVIIRTIFGKGNYTTYSSRRGYRSGGGFWGGGFGGGGFGGGSSGGGGFGGFGGGSFGGGGAGGDW